jgi:hypothetical protein
MSTQPEQKLHKDHAAAKAGDRIAFDFHRQAWFPVNGHPPQGAVTATLNADAVYDRQHGMRSRAIAFNLEHGEGDAQEEIASDA